MHQTDKNSKYKYNGPYIVYSGHCIVRDRQATASGACPNYDDGPLSLVSDVC